MLIRRNCKTQCYVNEIDIQPMCEQKNFIIDSSPESQLHNFNTYLSVLKAKNH